jgi:hypothetical protein
MNWPAFIALVRKDLVLYFSNRRSFPPTRSRRACPSP